MRTTWLFGLSAILLSAACAHPDVQTLESAQAFATMPAPRGGLAASSADSCPQVPDAPEVRAAARSLPPPRRTPAQPGAPEQGSPRQGSPQQDSPRQWSQSYTGRYDRCGALTAAVVSVEGDDDPLGPRQVLFFHDGGFVGAADSCAFGRTEIKSARGGVVVVQYRWPRGQETATTMSGSANVRYRWSGDKVVRVDPIPRELYDAVGCKG